MCGICGLVTFRPDREVKEETLHRMCGAMRHRGPDDEGIFIEDGVGIGMRRLSIIDLNSGHQPIHNEDRTIWLVFNGEIYNYPVLREELLKLGHSFYTQTDTEVVVHAYEQWGDSFVEKAQRHVRFCYLGQAQAPGVHRPRPDGHQTPLLHI